jgi:dTDP-4-dehydrorhamnose reductase
VSRRVFIAGKRGQLARALDGAYLANGCQVLCAGRSTVDITDEAAVAKAVFSFQPDLIINAAAYTMVDKAEDESYQAYRTNCDGARYLAAAARNVSAPLIHISTDYVYDGAKLTPYVETDTPNPIGVYGLSKLAGEAAIASETSSYLILRTSWLFSSDGNNFVKTILQLATQRETIEVVDDQWGNPTFAADLANAIVTIEAIWRAASYDSALCGIYHATAPGETTWYLFACAIMDLLAANGCNFCRVDPIATSQRQMRAKRPLNSRLDTSKLARTFGVRLPPWRIALEQCVRQLAAERG